MKKLLFFFFSFLLLFFFFGKSRLLFADELGDLQKKIAEYQQQIDSLQDQEKTLKQQIALMDSQIKLTGLKIIETQNKIKILTEEIKTLSAKIVRLEDSLNFISKVLLERLAEAYKSSRIDPTVLLFSSRNFSEFVLRYRYLQKLQFHDRELLLSMEKTRTNYDDQKTLKAEAQKSMEKLGKQLVVQKAELNSQVAVRKKLLDETKGKEAVYQKLLADARAELEAILGILEGKGSEKEVRKVSPGERIASVINGASCNSSGTHLHFMIAQDGQTKDPLSYLKGIDFENCTGSSCGSGDGDSINFSGNWDWPLNPKISIYQGYGYTWAIRNTWVGRVYNFHNGIDVKGSSLEVKTPKSGTLYLGSFVGNCTLRYVRVHHDEGFDTYYLHVNY